MLQIQNYFKYLEIQKSDIVADIGCGLGATSVKLSQEFPINKIYSIDIDEENVSKFKNNIQSQNIEIIWGDVEEFGGTRLSDGSVDKFIIENLLYTLKNKKSFLLELKRIVKKGSIGLVSDFKKHVGENIGHKSMLLDRDHVERLFVEAGFMVYPVEEDVDEVFNFIFKANR